MNEHVSQSKHFAFILFARPTLVELQIVGPVLRSKIWGTRTFLCLL